MRPPWLKRVRYHNDMRTRVDRAPLPVHSYTRGVVRQGGALSSARVPEYVPQSNENGGPHYGPYVPPKPGPLQKDQPPLWYDDFYDDYYVPTKPGPSKPVPRPPVNPAGPSKPAEKPEWKKREPPPDTPWSRTKQLVKDEITGRLKWKAVKWVAKKAAKAAALAYAKRKVAWKALKRYPKWERDNVKRDWDAARQYAEKRDAKRAQQPKRTNVFVRGYRAVRDDAKKAVKFFDPRRR